MIVVHENGMLIKMIEDEEDEKLKKDVVVNIRGGNWSRMDLANWKKAKTQQKKGQAPPHVIFFFSKKKGLSLSSQQSAW